MSFENGQSAAKHLKSWYDSGEGSTTILVGGVLIKISRFDWEKVDFEEASFFVYCLACPTTLEIRYIGITNNPRRRYANHFCVKSENTWKKNWVKQLRSRELKPIMLFLEKHPMRTFMSKTVGEVFIDNRETEMIHLFFTNGFRLVNHEKLAAFQKGRYAMGGHKNRKKVYQYLKSGNFLHEWKCLKDVVEHHDMSYPALSSAITRKNKCFGYYWSLKKMNKFQFAPFYDRGKRCHQYDLFGNFICSHNSVAEAAKSTGINRNSIKDNINGNQLSAGKFIFSSKEKGEVKKYHAKSNRYKKIFLKEDIV